MRFLKILVAGVVVAGVLATGALAFGFDDSKLPPNGQVGASYSFKFQVKPGNGTPPISYAKLSGDLPPGLTLADEGTLSGVPTQAGKYTFWMEARDSLCKTNPSCLKSQRLFTIEISTRLIVATNSLPDAKINEAYPPQQLSASGGSVSSWTVVSGSLPPGLTLSTSGQLSGTPTEAGGFAFTVQATGSPNNDTKQLTIFVLAPLQVQTLLGKEPPNGRLAVNGVVGAPLSTGVKAVGGRAPYTFGFTGAFPEGVTMDTATGLITGTPVRSGAAVATVEVTDSGGTKASVRVIFTIKPLLAFQRGALPRGVVNQEYSATIGVTGAAETKIFAMSGQLPPGLELNEATGELTGIPLKAGAYKFKVYVFDGAGTFISRGFTLRIRRA